MKKLKKNGTFRLKAFHLIFFVMWAGGVGTLVTVRLLCKPVSADMFYIAAQIQMASI